MKIPKDCEIPGHNSKDWALHVSKNIYGGKDSDRVWYLYLRAQLESIGFKVSKHDECVFFKGHAMYVLYTDDSILVGPNQRELDDIIKDTTRHGTAHQNKKGHIISTFGHIMVLHDPSHYTKNFIVNFLENM